jgi:hypothetical protein
MPTAKESLTDLHKAISRSFHLIPHCGALLPARVLPQTGLAYLARPGRER